MYSGLEETLLLDSLKKMVHLCWSVKIHLGLFVQGVVEGFVISGGGKVKERN